MRFALLLALLIPGADLAAAPGRHVSDRCVEIAGTIDRDAEPDALWNAHYARGFRAIGEDDYELAELEMCRAALVSRKFGPRDWRFAETLDELGLIGYQLGDLDLAEAVQGAAVAEMLLALGPVGEPPRPACGPVPDCRSSLRVYIERLGFIDRRLGQTSRSPELLGAPWRIFDAGYVRLDAELAGRLDWLISQYLLEEELEAAEALSKLRERILREHR